MQIEAVCFLLAGVPRWDKGLGLDQGRLCKLSHIQYGELPISTVAQQNVHPNLYLQVQTWQQDQLDCIDRYKL